MPARANAMRVGLDHQKGVGAGRKPGSCSHPAAPPPLLAGQPTLGLSTTATCWDPCEPPAASPPRQPSPRIASGRGVGLGHPGATVAAAATRPRKPGNKWDAARG